MVHPDEDALDPREEEHHDLPLALVTHHLEGDGDVAKIGHSVSQEHRYLITMTDQVNMLQIYFKAIS